MTSLYSAVLENLCLCYFIVVNVPVRANCFKSRTRLDQAGRGGG